MFCQTARVRRSGLLARRDTLVLVMDTLSWWLCLIFEKVTCDLGWQDLKLMSAVRMDSRSLGMTCAGYLLGGAGLLPPSVYSCSCLWKVWLCWADCSRRELDRSF